MAPPVSAKPQNLIALLEQFKRRKSNEHTHECWCQCAQYASSPQRGLGVEKQQLDEMSDQQTKIKGSDDDDACETDI
jgi:hypothetical protein